MIKALADQEWAIGGRPVHVRLARRLPEVVEEEFDEAFAQEYPQLAVALGGALPHELDERRALKDRVGGELAPGQLTRFATRGV
jgi:hypothetical protein